MVAVFLADGFEEVEAVAPIDILRRAGVEVQTVGVTGKTVCGAHGMVLAADMLPEELDENEVQGVILPGGMPGTTHLDESAQVHRWIDFAAQNGLLLGAICAAPSVLGKKGLLAGKRATCFPGFEKYLTGATLVDAPAVIDGKTVTGWGAGGALAFGLALVTVLKGERAARELGQKMRCTDEWGM